MDVFILQDITTHTQCISEVIFVKLFTYFDNIELFNFFRKKDININAAISDKEEVKTMYFIDELNTQNTLENNHLSFLKNHYGVKDDEISIRETKTKRLDAI